VVDLGTSFPCAMKRRLMAYKCGLGAGDYSPADALSTVNRMVAGSSPARGANYFKDLWLKI
jgi:hypothetical protein